MTLEKVLDLENDGVNMAACNDFLYIRCKRDVLKYSINDMKILSRKAIFKKDGKSRGITVDESNVYLFDFCDYYVLDKDNLDIKSIAHIGSDLSSDLCGIRTDKQKAYISIRNGKMAVTDKNNFEITLFDISSSSSWDFTIYNDCIYVGCVTGELLEIDAKTMSIKRIKQLHKKNIYSVYVYDGVIYTVSQDMSVIATDIETFEIIASVKKAVKGMVRIIGFYENDILISNTGKISFFDKKSLEFKKNIEFPTGVFNKGVLLYKNTLYGSDKQGVYTLRIDE